MRASDAKSLVLQKVSPKDINTLTSVTIPTPADNSSLDDILKEVEQLSLDALKALIRSIITIIISKLL